MKKKAFTLCCCSLLFSLLSVWIIFKKRIFAFFRAVSLHRYIADVVVILFHFWALFTSPSFNRIDDMLCARKLWTHAWKHIFNGKIHALCRMYNGRCRLPKVGTRGTNMQKTAASKHCATSWQHTRGKLPLSCIWLVSVISFILLHSFVCLLAFFFLFRTKCDFSAFFLFYSSSHFFFVCLFVQFSFGH